MHGRLGRYGQPSRPTHRGKPARPAAAAIPAAEAEAEAAAAGMLPHTSQGRQERLCVVRTSRSKSPVTAVLLSCTAVPHYTTSNCSEEKLTHDAPFDSPGGLNLANPAMCRPLGSECVRTIWFFMRPWALSASSGRLSLLSEGALLLHFDQRPFVCCPVTPWLGRCCYAVCMHAYVPGG